MIVIVIFGSVFIYIYHTTNEKRASDNMYPTLLISKDLFGLVCVDDNPAFNPGFFTFDFNFYLHKCEGSILWNNVVNHIVQHQISCIELRLKSSTLQKRKAFLFAKWMFQSFRYLCTPFTFSDRVNNDNLRLILFC